MFLLRFFLASLLALLVWGQDQPAISPNPPTANPTPRVFEYTGKPLSLPLECSEEDLRSAGLACTDDEPCPMYLEITSVEGLGNKLVATGNVHSSSATLQSVLVVSDDAGHTWREATDRIRAGTLDRIQILDADNAWITGQVMLPLPQEPFLLVTSDGGKSWRRRPILTDSIENRVGAIQQYFFTSKDTGSLILDRGQGSDSDRYELYESQDGGDSWTIKETNRKPLQLKRPPPASTNWRVRADGPSQSFHLEHRQSERWTSTGAFLVKLGVCKP
jgi:photosystem II stability/assembly factor-like uncharacterized protein